MSTQDEAKQVSSTDEIKALLSRVLGVNVEQAFPFCSAQDFEYARRELAAGMRAGTVHLNLRDTNSDNAKRERLANDRLPTEFETKVLRYLARHDRVILGNKSVQYVAAARRLERLGYTGKGIEWYITDKGKKFLDSQNSAQEAK